MAIRAQDRKKGIPLKDAPYYFAPSPLRAQYDNPTIPPPKITRGFRLLADAIGESDKRQRILKDMVAVQERSDILQAQVDGERQMRERLLDAFRREKLVAYGILLPRTRNSVPEKIPDDLFQPEFISWGRSSIKGNGCEFVAVNVFRPEWARKMESRSLRAVPRPIGRPSSKKPIIEAIHALINERAIPKGSRKKDYDLIRKRVRQRQPDEFPDDNGLSDKTIAKYLMIELARAHSAKRHSPKP